MTLKFITKINTLQKEFQKKEDEYIRSGGTAKQVAQLRAQRAKEETVQVQQSEFYVTSRHKLTLEIAKPNLL